jgi:hypothetical protein
MKNLLRQELAVLLVGAIWAVAYFFAFGVLRAYQFAEWQRVAVALLPILPFVFFIGYVVSNIRRFDELHRRVHLEALVIAFPLTMLLLMTLGLIDLAIGLSSEDWSYRHVWYYVPLFYFIGLAVAWRRYR